MSSCAYGKHIRKFLATHFRRQLPHLRNNPHEKWSLSFMNSQQGFIFPRFYDHQHVIQTIIFKYFVPDTPFSCLDNSDISRKKFHNLSANLALHLNCNIYPDHTLKF